MQIKGLRMFAIVSIMCASGPLLIAQVGREDQYQRAVERGHGLASEAIERSDWHRRLSDFAIECGQILVADGDSWFDYPLRPDIVSALEIENWAVFSAARSGDTLESMMYDNSQLSSLYRILARAFFLDETIEYDEDISSCKYDIVRNASPKAILLSAGGNDILGDELAFLLEHADSSAVDDDRVNQRLKGGLFYRLERILIEYVSAIRFACRDVSEKYNSDSKCQNIPIIIHGYDYAEATGIGYRVLGVTFRGPWIRPRT